jgi:tetratricopeptide (TPR) repeat protein
VTTENLELAQTQYQTGKAAFERGQYRQAVESLEQAVKLVARGTALGGEMQIWLVTAYQAAGKQTEAIALCQTLEAHPDLKTRKQSRRLLYILQAPQLKTRPEWLSQIPDLTDLEDSTSDNKGSSRFSSTPAKPARLRSRPEPEPVDLSQVNTKDNGFVWVAFGAIAAILTALIWLNLQ